jgi:hypothetical protein
LDILNQLTITAAAAIVAEVVAKLEMKTGSLEVSDQKMEAALKNWRSTPAVCKKDVVLAHTLAKIRECARPPAYSL